MSVERDTYGTVTFTGDDIQIFRLFTLRAGLALEADTGMRMTRGRSCYAIVKQEYGFKGNKHRVLEQLDEFLEFIKQEA